MRMRFLTYLLPIALLGVTSVLFYGAVTKDREPTQSPRAAATASASVSRQDASICQGLFQRPAPGAPVSFPAHYTQRRDHAGLVILASPGVDPKAFDIAEQTIDTMFATNSLKDYLVAEGAYIVIRDGDERVTDLPEFACLASRYGPGFIDHICGVADDADYPIATVSELDLLGDREGPCRGLNVLYHEIGHLVQTWAIGPADYYDVKQFYQDALSAGKYSGAYAGSNANEYFAEGTQAYFLSVDPRGRQNRAWLRSYDPDLFALLDRIYDD